MDKILVLGSTGMLGHVVADVLEKADKYEVIRANRHPAKGEVFFDGKPSIVEQIKPDFIVNCVGVLVNASERNPELAKWINADLPHALASKAQKYGGRLVHVSTDCVFDGKKGNYLEDDPSDAENVYGKTKALGEVLSPDHVTIRTSIVGPELKKNGTGLLHWFLTQKGPIQGYTNVFWNGVTTTQLAEFIKMVMYSKQDGLIHLASDTVSKKILLNMMSGVWKKSISIIDDGAIHSDRTLSPTFHARPIELQLQELHKYMVQNKERYIPIYGEGWI